MQIHSAIIIIGASAGAEAPSAARWDAAEAQAKARTFVLRALLHEQWLQTGE